MTRIKGRLDEFLSGVRLAIINTVNDPVISGMMASYGYNAEKMNAVEALYVETVALVNTQMKEYEEQFEACEELGKAYREANSAYMKSLKLARVALAGKAKAHSEMMVYGPRKTSLSGWIKQAVAFYENLKNDNELLAEMAKFGRSPKALETEYELVKKVAVYQEKQRKESLEAQNAARVRDEKLDELGKWLADFQAVAKIAFWHNPQRMEAVGVYVNAPGKRRTQRKHY